MKRNETRTPHFIRLSDVPELYRVGRNKASDLVKEAKAGYKVGGAVMVDVEKMDAYVRSCMSYEE